MPALNYYHNLTILATSSFWINALFMLMVTRTGTSLFKYQVCEICRHCCGVLAPGTLEMFV